MSLLLPFYWGDDKDIESLGCIDRWQDSGIHVFFPPNFERKDNLALCDSSFSGSAVALGVFLSKRILQ